MMRKELDIGRDEHVYTSAKVYVKEVNATDVPRRLNVWYVSKRHPIM